MDASEDRGGDGDGGGGPGRGGGGTQARVVKNRRGAMLAGLPAINIRKISNKNSSERASGAPERCTTEYV